jgi:hypothetical protein
LNHGDILYMIINKKTPVYAGVFFISCVRSLLFIDA